MVGGSGGGSSVDVGGSSSSGGSSDVGSGVSTTTDMHVERIELDRPDTRNALSREDRYALQSALERADRDPAVRVIVISGRGGQFCAGGDVREFTLERDQLEAYHYALTTAQAVFRTLRAMSTPTIACVQGAAAGAGMYLALGCDIVIAARGAFFHPGHLDLALVPDWGAVWLLPRLIGMARAKALMLTGSRLPAERAAEWGLIAECVEADEIGEVLQRYTDRIAEIASAPMSLTRRGLDASLDRPLDSFLEWEASAIAEVMPSAEHRERVEWFLARRRPR